MTAVQTAYRSVILDHPDGFFGSYGGCYVPEVLLPGLQEIAAAFETAKNDPVFQADFHAVLREFAGRPTAFTPLPRLTAEIGGARLFLKNEGLNHTGAHKITHCIGQILLARRLGK
ncbi:MAG TPA: hypothetical protein PLW66_07385, partial [Saprospiraceae bacterium]|nr:hypothetical protein [Saprospiraceae bacterium]